ncbi:MAG: hypothetical protein IJY38_03295, partial [Clostridia bacterium]|nr:hypothetical protein [Clostridia bacterium]
AKMVTVNDSKANTAQGYRNLVTGQNNQTDEKTYQANVSGCRNTLSDCNNSIVAGLRNYVGPTENKPDNGSDEEESEGVSERGADNCVVAGYKNSVLMQDALVVGDNNTVTNENGGSGSIVGGVQNTVKAGYNAVFGSTNTVENEFNAVFGRKNTLGSDAGGNIVGGEGNTTNADRSVIGGLNNQVDHSECGVFGRYLQTGRANQLVCGRYNEPDANAMFIVGYDGATSAGTRTNIFTVNKNGTATVFKNPVNAKDVSTKEYVDSAIAGLNVEVKRYLHNITLDCSNSAAMIFYLTFINNNPAPFTNINSAFAKEILNKICKLDFEGSVMYGAITESTYVDTLDNGVYIRLSFTEFSGDLWGSVGCDTSPDSDTITDSVSEIV